MLGCAFGVANHSPEDVVSALMKFRNIRASDIGILPPAAKVDVRFKHLLMLSTADLARNFKRLDSADTKVFVFSDPISLAEFSGLRGIDYANIDDFSFKRMPLDITSVFKSTPVEIHRQKNDFLPRLIASVTHGSLLTPLMTFIYSLSSQNQNTVKRAAVRFLYEGLSQRWLADEVSLCLTERASDKLLSILTTSIAEAYAVAMQQVRAVRKAKKDVNIAALAKQFSVSDYELSYMLSVLTSKEKFADSFDKAKNRKTQIKKVPK